MNVIRTDYLLPDKNESVFVKGLQYEPEETKYTISFLNGPATATSYITAGGYIIENGNLVTLVMDHNIWTGSGSILSIQASLIDFPEYDIVNAVPTFDGDEIIPGYMVISTSGLVSLYPDVKKGVFTNGVEYIFPPSQITYHV